MLVGLVLVPEPVTLPQGGAPWSLLGPLGRPDLWWSVVRGGSSASSEAHSMGPFQERCCFDRQRGGRYWSNLFLRDSPWSSYGREGDLPWVRRPSVAREGHPWIRWPSCGGGGGVVPGSGGHLWGRGRRLRWVRRPSAVAGVSLGSGGHPGPVWLGVGWSHPAGRALERIDFLLFLYHSPST